MLLNNRSRLNFDEILLLRKRFSSTRLYAQRSNLVKTGLFY